MSKHWEVRTMDREVQDATLVAQRTASPREKETTKRSIRARAKVQIAEGRRKGGGKAYAKKGRKKEAKQKGTRNKKGRRGGEDRGML